MNPFPIKALTEEDFDGIIDSIGGMRAHLDADRRERKGADYLIDGTLIELKILDDEGLTKAPRQEKLAKLFSTEQPNRPVVVLDPEALSSEKQHKYQRIVEGPVKTAIAKARVQLAQSREEIVDATGSVLWIVNNGYTSIDHEDLEELVSHRVRNDTTSIDGVIVAGCYYHSDGFDSVFLWPCTYIPINLAFGFPEFEKLQVAFQGFAEKFMSTLINLDTPIGEKLAVSDVTFDLGGKRYVRPAPHLGKPSDFYVNGRPRRNSTGFEKCPPVALIVPDLSRSEHNAVREISGEKFGPLSTYEAWLEFIEEAREEASEMQPLVAIPVDAQEWLSWCRSQKLESSRSSLLSYAHEKFVDPMNSIISRARERTSNSLVLSSYILAVTEEIGQDCENDVSDIAVVRERPHGEPIIRPLVEDARIFHEHAVALAAAYALSQGVGAVLWQKERSYCWT
ncbi:hypothetical protein [Sphingorhabdus sp. EL138]|uniref:hypothetical protein n=1 Tax=Sphingorhabdus sp. EL138 TaxID=2073156 RepID=UPI000D68BE87|nr:hypothetical protein [Sphingorhabdus sp. EL138]